MSANILAKLTDYEARRAALLQNAQAFEVAGGGRYSERYAERYDRERGAVGQRDNCGNWVNSSTGAGHGRRVVDPGARDSACTPLPPRCDCHVIGVNSINSAGVLSGATGNLTIDSGDASYFIPYYIAIVAFQVNGTDNGLIANPGTPLMVLLLDSVSGREPNMRRASNNDPTFGVWTLIYGFEKEIECVDWRKFASTNNQQLTMTFYNPNNADVHVFVNIWGMAAA